MTDVVETLEATVRRYFQGCNLADAGMIRSCFTPDAVHYFPPGMYGGPWRGASTIADNWLKAVATIGSYWTLDRLICDPRSMQAVAEWTHFKTLDGSILRGDEWYRFTDDGRAITEIRAYYAAPQRRELTANELHGYDYRGQGYAMEAPRDAYPR